MEFNEILKILLIIFLLLFSSFFSSSEAALFSLSLLQRERIRKNDSKKAMLIEKLLLRPRRLIVTILVGNDMVNIAASVLATYLFVSLMGLPGKWVTVAVMTPLTLIFAEVIPKTLSVSRNERVASFVAGPLELFAKLISPLRATFDKVADLLIRLFGVEKPTGESVIMEDDFLDMVDLSHAEGQLRGVERDLIHNVFEFSDVRVNEVMIPVAKMSCLTYDMTGEDILKAIKEHQYSRVPVYQGTVNNIKGILYSKDLLKVDMNRYRNRPGLLAKICRTPHFVEETKKVDELFNIMKQRRIHLSICLDESGKVSGLATLEDILEELFGEIYDEYDTEGA